MNDFQLDVYLHELESIVNIDSGMFYAPGTNAIADFFIERYSALGMNVKREFSEKDTEKTSPIVIARNSDSDTFDLTFVGHMDTVFAVGEAAKRPFSVDSNGLAHGPGCGDCKAGIVMTYYIVRQLLKSGPKGLRICVVMDSDEEKGAKYSRPFMEEIAKHTRYCIVMEPGRAGGEYVKQRKGYFRYLVRCHGIPAHPGIAPEKGANAIYEMSRWVTEFYKYFNVDEGTTVNVGRFDGGGGKGDFGSVADYAEFTLDFRSWTAEQLNKLDALVHELAEQPFDPRCKIELELVSTRPPMEQTAEAEHLLELLKESGQEVGVPIVAVATGGTSDGNFFANLGVTTIDACGPTCSGLHTEAEYFDTKTVEPRMDVLLRLISKLFA